VVWLFFIIFTWNLSISALYHFAVYLGKGKVSHITLDNQGAKIEN